MSQTPRFGTLLALPTGHSSSQTELQSMERTVNFMVYEFLFMYTSVPIGVKGQDEVGR